MMLLDMSLKEREQTSDFHFDTLFSTIIVNIFYRTVSKPFEMKRFSANIVSYWFKKAKVAQFVQRYHNWWVQRWYQAHWGPFLKWPPPLRTRYLHPSLTIISVVIPLWLGGIYTVQPVIYPSLPLSFYNTTHSLSLKLRELSTWGIRSTWRVVSIWNTSHQTIECSAR